MTRIALLSDTHCFFDENLYRLLENCDEIWHTGDIGNTEVADKLAAFKPLRAVYGNIDNHVLRQMFPRTLAFQCEGVKVAMTHIGGYPGRYDAVAKELIVREKPTLFLCGHSHILKVMYDEKFEMLTMNPGAFGNHGFHKVRTLLRFEIDGSNIQNLEVVELPRIYQGEE